VLRKNWMKKRIGVASSAQHRAFQEVNNLIIKNRSGKKITLTDGTTLTEFVSCSYLGLDLDKRLIAASNKNIKNLGVAFHSSRVRMQPESYLELDNLLHQIYNAHPISFPTLHMAHLGIIPLLASGEMPSFPLQSGGPCFIIDRTAHSSIQIHRGLMEQFGSVHSIDFRQVDIIEEYFRNAHKEKTTPIAFADSIGSMGGIAPIMQLLELAERYNGYIYLDDAHGTSVHGKHGSGYVMQCLEHRFHPRLILTSTLGKAFGALGGVLLVPTAEDAKMVNCFSPTYIFSGPPAISLIDSAIASAKIHLTDEIYMLQNKLWHNVKYFDNLLHEQHIINATIPSPIRGVYVGNENKTISLTAELQRRGIAVTAAIYPTVRRGQGILRAAVSAAHTEKEIAHLCHNIIEISQPTEETQANFNKEFSCI